MDIERKIKTYIIREQHCISVTPIKVKPHGKLMQNSVSTQNCKAQVSDYRRLNLAQTNLKKLFFPYITRKFKYSKQHLNFNIMVSRTANPLFLGVLEKLCEITSTEGTAPSGVLRIAGPLGRCCCGDLTVLPPNSHILGITFVSAMRYNLTII